VLPSVSRVRFRENPREFGGGRIVTGPTFSQNILVFALLITTPSWFQ
jgi:hypothetical protein